MLSDLDPKRPKDIRDRVILMLFAFYGLRRSEVSRLTLDDIDWERDLLHVTRAKRGGRHTFPLSASLGNALLQYLRTVRAVSSERALFFTFTYPLHIARIGHSHTGQWLLPPIELSSQARIIGISSRQLHIPLVAAARTVR